MALNLPTNSKTVKDRIKTDIQVRLALSNPFKKGSWLRAFAESLGERMFDFYFTILQAIEEVFADTTIDNLDRIGSFYGISRLAASRSTGLVIINGTAAAVIPIGHKLVDANGNLFSLTAGGTLVSTTITQNTLAQSGGLATFTATADHFLVSGMSVTISGAADAEYNSTFVITVTANDVFTFAIDSGSAASTTGASTSTFGISLAVLSDDSDLDTNLDAFALLTLQTPITNANDSSGVDESGLSGGSDRETIEAFRARLLDIIRNPVAHFNVSDITRVAKAVNLVTRVFVSEATPAAGQVTIHPMVDNETNSIPGAATVTAVKNAVLAIKPANVSDADVIVTAPTAESTAFTFSALSPSTVTMKTSIEANLAQFFAENVIVGTTVTEDSYRSAIFSTIDTTTGEPMVSFALSAPTGDQSASSSDHIRTLGAVAYP